MGLCKLSKRKFFFWPANIYIEFWRNTPPLIQIIWIFYVMPIIFSIRMDAFLSCLIALGLNSSAYQAEIFRAGIQSVEKGLIEAAFSSGLSYFQIMRRIILPIAIRRMTPPFLNEFVTKIKGSSLVSVVGLTDLLYRAQALTTTSFRPIELLTSAAIIYFILCTALSYSIGIVEKKYRI
jgi:His/Glu/Gln/Arg/opine family amino acid ABC transporter permease subunit